MSRTWEHLEPIPRETRVTAPDGTESVEPLREPREGELVVRILATVASADVVIPGAVVEVVAVQEKDELVVGDRLWIFDRAPCGHCEICRRGFSANCPDAARVLIPSFASEFLVVPAWIARRGRVRLPMALSDASASELGSGAWILRALHLHACANPLRILVVADGPSAQLAGILIETRWPDARRVLCSETSAEGYHRSSIDPTEILAGLEHPADLVLCLRSVQDERIRPLIGPGARILLAGGASLETSESLWSTEAMVGSSVGAVPSDLEDYRKYFAAFSMRWDALGR